MVAGIDEVGGTRDMPAVVGDQVEDCVGGVDRLHGGDRQHAQRPCRLTDPEARAALAADVDDVEHGIARAAAIERQVISQVR